MATLSRLDVPPLPANPTAYTPTPVDLQSYTYKYTPPPANPVARQKVTNHLEGVLTPAPSSFQKIKNNLPGRKTEPVESSKDTDISSDFAWTGGQQGAVSPNVGSVGSYYPTPTVKNTLTPQPKKLNALTSPVKSNIITSAFGVTRNVGSSPHKGTDYGVRVGTEIFATANGNVVRAGWSSSYGNIVIIDHGPVRNSKKRVYTLYAHGSKLNVKVGDAVSINDIIMLSGESGSAATGPHLHYEVIKTNYKINSNDFYKHFSDRHAPKDLIVLLNN